MQRFKRGDDLRQEIEVHRAEGAGVDIRFGLAYSQVDGLVRADVQKRAGVVLGELSKPLLDQRERAGLAGREHGAVGGLGQRLVLLPNQGVTQVAEGFLLRHHRDVVARRERGQLACLGGRDVAAGRRWQRVRGVLLGVFKVGRIEVDLIRRELLDQMFLKGQGRHRAARKIVVQAAILHRGPVADGGQMQDRGRCRRPR